MTDDARRLAISALVRIDTEGAFANVVLPHMLDGSDLDSRDRGFVTELVYGSTRRRRALDHVVDRYLMQDPPPTARAALRIGAYQLIELGTPAHAAVSATVSASPKRFRGLVNAVLRKVSTAAGDGIEYPTDAIELSYPDWIVDLLRSELGTGIATDALKVMNKPASVSRREDGYIQDESSRLVADAVPIHSGALVLDLCAAPGGKATAMAGGGAVVVAADLRPRRVGLIASNRESLGLDRLHPVVADGLAPPFRPGIFDAVLVDAPCSGLGALRRRPDARWRIGPGDIQNLSGLQTALIAQAVKLVKPGGSLVYSVCTLTDAETSGSTEAALTDGALDEFAPVRPQNPKWHHRDDANVSMLYPGEDHDGMGISIWRRGT